MKCHKCGCLVDELCDLVKHFDGEPVIVDNL